MFTVGLTFHFMATPPFQFTQGLQLQNDAWLFSPTLSLKHIQNLTHVLPPSLLPPWSKLVWAIIVSCWDCFNSLLNGLPCFYSNSLLSRKQMIILNLSQTPTSLCLETFKGLLLHTQEGPEVLMLTEKSWLCYFFCDLISSHSAPAPIHSKPQKLLLFLSGSHLPKSLWTPPS